MSVIDERAFLFDCASTPAVGVLSLPADRSPTVGLLIVVGGPQYRVGAHRQFVQLARHAAEQGCVAMRFDYRGMGDSWEDLRDFEGVATDLHDAIEAFYREVPSLERLVLWGLCDGASAACLHVGREARVDGLILFNPWVHTEAGEAATRLKHYYTQRLVSREFWRKLLRGGVSWRTSAQALVATLRRYLHGQKSASAPGRGTPLAPDAPLPDRMAAALQASGLPIAIGLSGNDRVAQEFEDVAVPMPAWKTVFQRQLVEMEHIPDADHTLASAQWQAVVHRLTMHWLDVIVKRWAVTRRG